MIWNIIDRRTRPYRWAKITAIIEPTHHDNSCEDADHAEDNPDATVYQARDIISVSDAVSWGQSLPFAATLYLYDLGKGTSLAFGDSTDHFVRLAERFDGS